MRVLFVEDEPRARSGLTALLRSQGYTIDFVESCEAAEDAFRTASYDIVILDIMLPPGNYDRQRGVIMDAGVALLDTLRQGNISESKTKADVPVVALTAVASAAIHGRILRHRGVYLAEKPIDPEEVVQLIQTATANGDVRPNTRIDTDAE